MPVTLRKKKLIEFRPQIRSRHPSHSPLRTELAKLPFKSVVRLGSTTELPDTVTNGGNRLEVNTVEAIETSSDKLLMKQAFTQAGVVTCDWGYFEDVCWFDPFDDMVDEKDGNLYAFIVTIDGDVLSNYNERNDKGHYLNCEELKFPVVMKHRFGSRGTGNTLISSLEDLKAFVTSHEDRLDDYLMESYFSGTREYRLHLTEEGCFYTNRKMLKAATPEDKRWYRNDSNCVWIVEENPQFDKPVNWQTIVHECVHALKATGLDVGAIDLRVQSTKDKNGNVRENPEFQIIEINSAPSFGEGTTHHYLEVLPQILRAKAAAL